MLIYNQHKAKKTRGYAIVECGITPLGSWRLDPKKRLQGWEKE